MDKFQAFLKGKKINKHFKKSGPGVRLSETSSSQPSVVSGTSQGGEIDRISASDVAAQAALKRLYKDTQQNVPASQKKIQMIAQRELEEEKRKQNSDAENAIQQLSLESEKPAAICEFEHSSAMPSVYYTCELLGDDICMKKSELVTAIEEFLNEQISDNTADAIIPSVLLLYSVNLPPVKMAAVETMSKYLQNIIENPHDPKFRRIRVANKAFQERVVAAKGGIEFLRAVGFYNDLQALKEGDPLENFYIMPENIAEDTGRLIVSLEALRDGQCIPIKVARNTSIFLLREDERVPVPKVSTDFFDLTADEVKREQQLKTDEVNKLLSLRTKEMREKDEKLRKYKYKYTLIRIRLPDRYVIQGTFGCYEPLSAVRDFIHKHLNEELLGCIWKVKDSMASSTALNENSTLGELSLAPAVVLHVEFDQPIKCSTLAEKYKKTASSFVN